MAHGIYSHHARQGFLFSLVSRIVIRVKIPKIGMGPGMDGCDVNRCHRIAKVA